MWVKLVVVLSTDKTVYPIRAIGTMAVAEKIMLTSTRAQRPGETVLCAPVMATSWLRGGRLFLYPSICVADYVWHPITVTDPNMARSLMSLEDSDYPVLHAFQHGQQGDIFVQMATASTFADPALALKELFVCHTEIITIGTRHGDKLYGSLMSCEEMAHAKVMDDYFRMPADNRDINYVKYYSEGGRDLSRLGDYTPHNTRRLKVEQIKLLLLGLDFIKEELNA